MASDDDAFDEWLATEQNADALARLDAKLALFDAPHGRIPELEALRDEAYSLPPHRDWWRRPAAAGALMAACVAALMMLTPIGRHLGDFASPSPAPQPELAAAQTEPSAIPERKITASQASTSTKVGEQRLLILADGTRVTMNTDTRLAIDYTAPRRTVRLLAGQALFEVAHDPQRPFTVIAGDRSVTALGTVFEIRVKPGELDVMLVTGRVAVVPIADEAIATPSRPVDRPVILLPGQAFAAKAGLQASVSRIDVESRLLWRQRLVEFKDVSLSDAVAELNRYSEQPILLRDAEVGSMRIGGVYDTGDAASFVAIIEQMLPLKARKTAQGSYELSRRS